MQKVHSSLIKQNVAVLAFEQLALVDVEGKNFIETRDARWRLSLMLGDRFFGMLQNLGNRWKLGGGAGGGRVGTDRG